MNELRTIIIGCGNFARSSIPGIQSHEAFDVVGLVNRGEPNRNKAGEQAGIDESCRCANLDDALDKLKPNFAFIFTNVGTHAEFAKKCIAAGCNVSITKPYTESLAEGQELAEFAREHEKWISVGQTARFGPLNITVKQAVTRGDIGTPAFANFIEYRDRMQNIPDYQLAESWPVINATSIHDYDYLSNLFGSLIVRVSFRGIDAEWNPYSDPGVTSGWLEFENGIVVNYFRSFVSRVYYGGGFPPSHSMIQGSGGAIIWDAPWYSGEVKLHQMENPDDQQVTSLPIDNKDFDAQTYDYCQWMYESISEGREIFAPPEENLWVLAAVKASEASAKQNGKVIDVIEFGKAQGLPNPTA